MGEFGSKQLKITINDRCYSFSLKQTDPRFKRQLLDLYDAFEASSHRFIEIQADFDWGTLNHEELQTLGKLKKFCHLYDIEPIFDLALDVRRTRKKVLCVDNAQQMHRLFKKIFKAWGGEIESIHCDNSREALELVKKENFDAYIFSYEMPDLNGIELFYEAIKTLPRPTLFASYLSKDQCPAIVTALQEQNGFDYIQKPASGEVYDFRKTLGEKLCHALEVSLDVIPKEKRWKKVRLSLGRERPRCIVFGTSTGGPQVIRSLLLQISGEHPPIIICQHMPSDFIAPFARDLGEACELKVSVAKNGEKLEQSTVYICPGNLQTTVILTSQGLTFKVCSDPPRNNFRPSVDYLFEGLSFLFGIDIYPVLLTGIGCDGAQGLLQLKKRGHYTLVQNEETSIVYGMPKEAKNLGAVDKELPDDKIMEELAHTLSQKKSA